MPVNKYNNSYQPKTNNYQSNSNNTSQTKSNNVNQTNGNNGSSKGNNVNSPNNGGSGDDIASGFNEALADQQEAYQLSKRNKLDDLHNKAVLKGIDNAAGYI